MQEGAVARILFNVAQQRIAFHFCQAAVELFVAALKPFEGFVRFPSVSVDLGNLEGPIVLILFYVLGPFGINASLSRCAIPSDSVTFVSSTFGIHVCDQIIEINNNYLRMESRKVTPVHDVKSRKLCNCSCVRICAHENV